MSTPIFPLATPLVPLAVPPPWGWRGIAWDITKTPMWKTEVQQAYSGREARTSYWSSAIYHWTLTWNVLRDDGLSAVARNATRAFPQNEFQLLAGFFAQQKGDCLPFLYKDPTDHTALAQLIAVGDGVRSFFPLMRSLGDLGGPERIGALDDQLPYTITVNGGGSAPTVNAPYDGWIDFGAPLGAGAVVAGTFDYYFRVRFAKSMQAFRTFAADFWEARTVEFVGAWP